MRIAENSDTRDKCQFRQEGNCSASRGLPTDARTVIPSDGIFKSHRIAIMDSFSCDKFILSLNTLLFYEFYAKISQFTVNKCSVWFLSTTLMSKCLAENDVKN